MSWYTIGHVRKEPAELDIVNGYLRIKKQEKVIEKEKQRIAEPLSGVSSEIEMLVEKVKRVTRYYKINKDGLFEEVDEETVFKSFNEEIGEK